MSTAHISQHTALELRARQGSVHGVGVVAVAVGTHPGGSGYAVGLSYVEVEHGTIRLGVTSQGSPVESRYLTSAILPVRLSGLSSRGPALVFDRNLSSPNASESSISESDQSHVPR